MVSVYVEMSSLPLFRLEESLLLYDPEGVLGIRGEYSDRVERLEEDDWTDSVSPSYSLSLDCNLITCSCKAEFLHLSLFDDRSFPSFSDCCLIVTFSS